MKPQLTKSEWQHKGNRWCQSCKEVLPDHEAGCPRLREKTPKPWKKHNNRSNRTPEETDESQDDQPAGR